MGRKFGQVSAVEFAGILERHFGCGLKWGKCAVKVRRNVGGSFYGQCLHLSTKYHSGLQRTVLHGLGFSDDEIDVSYPR